ncbi:MAG: hypothetical protein DBX59_01935 [Bacillota bacterium]|nr:MAG: hypothetical protein DBX59_01935 [Bacillota bacterium]
MEEQEKKARTCWRCDRYNAYFTKTFIGITRENVGYCMRKREIVKKDMTACEEFCGRRARDIGRRKDRALKALEGLAQDMNVLKTILCDETEDRAEALRQTTSELKYYLKKYEESKNK